MNWGKSIALTMSLFILFIVGMVWIMVGGSDSLYDSDYYAKGENYSEEMGALHRGQMVNMKLIDGKLLVSLPDTGSLNQITLKNISDGRKDKSLTSNNSALATNFLLEVGSLEMGKWHFVVSGVMKDSTFVKQQVFFLP